MRICFLSPAVNESTYSESAANDRMDYCSIHGYQYVARETAVPKSPGYSEEKVYIEIQHLIQNYDWIFWAHADRYIMNFAFKLEDLMAEGAEMLLSRDRGAIEVGAILFKNTDSIRNCIDRALVELNSPSRSTLCQPVLQYFLKGPAAPNLRYLSRSVFSSDISTYTRGDFMLMPNSDQMSPELEADIFAQGSLMLEEKEQFPYLFNSLNLREAGAIVGIGRGEFADTFLGRWLGKKIWLIDHWKSSCEHTLKPYLVDDILDLDRKHAEQWFASDFRVESIRDTALSASERFAFGSLDWIFFR